MSEVDHPSHYGGDTPYEVIKVLRAWDLELAKGFCWGNLIKYTQRAGKKHSFTTEDRQKAKWYADELLDIEKELAKRAKKAPSEIPVVINGNGHYKLNIDWDNRKYSLDYQGGGGSGSSGGIGGSAATSAGNSGFGNTVVAGGGVGGGGGFVGPKYCTSAYGCSGGYHGRRCPLHKEIP